MLVHPFLVHPSLGHPSLVHQTHFGDDSDPTRMSVNVIYRLIADGSGKVPDDEALVVADVPVNGQLGLARNLKQKGCGCLLREHRSSAFRRADRPEAGS